MKSGALLLFFDTKKFEAVVVEGLRYFFQRFLTQFGDKLGCGSQIRGTVAFTAILSRYHKGTLSFNKHSIQGHVFCRVVQVSSISVGYVSCEGDVEIQFESFLSVLPIFRIAVQNSTSGRQLVLQYIQNIFAGFAIVNDYRQLKLVSQLKLMNKKLNLTVFIAEFSIVVQSDFTKGNYPVFLAAFLNLEGPVFSGIDYFGWRHTDAVVYMICCFQIFVDLKKVVKAITYAHDFFYVRLFSFLYD